MIYTPTELVDYTHGHISKYIKLHQINSLTHLIHYKVVFPMVNLQFRHHLDIPFGTYHRQIAEPRTRIRFASRTSSAPVDHSMPSINTSQGWCRTRFMKPGPSGELLEMKQRYSSISTWDQVL
jgi:hypothetical protein